MLHVFNGVFGVLSATWPVHGGGGNAGVFFPPLSARLPQPVGAVPCKVQELGSAGRSGLPSVTLSAAFRDEHRGA